jgi:hypothetical protein
MHSAAFPWFFLIPVVAIVGGLVIGAIAIITEHRRKQALLEERRLMIEKGLTPPPLGEHVLEPGGEAGTRSAIESSLRVGIITLFVGLGLIAFFLVIRFIVGAEFTVIPGPVIALLGPAGALVSLIGIGNLVYFWVASRRATSKM